MRPKLREILKGAKPFDPDAFKPLEGAEELLPELSDESIGVEAARRRPELDNQLRGMTAMWMARGEDIEYLASELREAKYALREIVGKEERCRRMPYRSQVSVLRTVGQIAKGALEDLQDLSE